MNSSALRRRLPSGGGLDFERRSTQRSKSIDEEASRLLASSTLLPDEIARWEARLQQLSHDCGCAAGATGLLIALVSLPVLFWIQPSGLFGVSWSGAATAGLVVLAGAAIGKTLGVWRARSRLRTAVLELNHIVAMRDAR